MQLIDRIEAAAGGSRELDVGDWVVCRSPGVSGEQYGAAQITRLTAKTVHANANCRNQFLRDQVVPMPDEAAARLFVERVKSAQAECSQRIRRARDARDAAIGKLIAAALKARAT